ncbi:MAG: tRNA (adenosine(37)-N6)-threonylcarbamoyltransferase complex ATPase subunit type 1 TsaE [Flavobacteriales bacterium]|nr:MAG: tRNA (adenosine(37)-N6)-threonylcarbamoyltransferase complex ATPase subunit type 1 TsaE [Flavobacteriales bacterium]
MAYKLISPAEAADVAQAILRDFPQVRVFALHGELGAGKTTLIKGFCRALGVVDSTSSPSFSLVNEYWSAHDGPVYHFDLYRLRDARELEGIGFTEYVDSDAYCFIEWPELADHLLPDGTAYIRIEVEGDHRILTVDPKANGH